MFRTTLTLTVLSSVWAGLETAHPNLATVAPSSHETECPQWLQDGPCKGYYDSPDTVHRYWDRKVTQDCPETCRVCPNQTTVDDGVDIVDYLVHQSNVHCVPEDGPSSRDIWGPGDNDRMYERIVRKFKHIYSPTVLSTDPWVILLENFTSQEEYSALIEETQLEILRGNAEPPEREEADDEGGVCHSTQAWCENDCLKRKEVKSLIRKAEDLVDMPFAYAEPIHLIEYEPGQEYGRHTDFNHYEVECMTGPRLFTVLMYFNDIVDGLGGDTCFPDVPTPNNQTICIKPKPGRALIWANVKNDRPWEIERRTYHQATVIQKGKKYASTFWYHLRNFKFANDISCSDDLDDIRADVEEFVYGPEDDDYDDYDEDYDDYEDGEYEYY
mmetsp:Transcript_12778/g.28072  ORF Transcript_12778/g.28072 Transcript_12778/m.28072 type:complete len:385 (-) Transcript_12778:88-1242(-)